MEPGTTIIDFEAIRAWSLVPERAKALILSNAFCINCGNASFAPGYAVCLSGGNILLRGKCAACGEPIARVVD